MKPSLLKSTENLSNSKKIFRYLGTIIVTLVFILVLITTASVMLQVVGGKKPSVFSYRLYYILTDSMEPELLVDDVIISQVITDLEEANGLKIGDVVTYEVAYGELKGMTMTHKVVKPLHYDKTYEKYVILTQGTKQGAPIDPPVPVENIEAVMVYKAVGIGNLYNFFKSPLGLCLLIGVPSLEILVTLIWKLIKENKVIKKNRILTDEEKKRKAELEKEIAEKAVADYKRTLRAPSASAKAELEKQIAERAVEEYKNSLHKNK